MDFEDVWLVYFSVGQSDYVTRETEKEAYSLADAFRDAGRTFVEVHKRQRKSGE